MTTTTRFDTDALRNAVESADPEAQLRLYAADAEVRLVDQEHPPSNPIRISGHDAIRAWLEDVAARDMTHEVTIGFVGEHGGGYSLQCRYASGERVSCAAMFELRDGLITRVEGVQAWDV
jgi:ketosteroid isomerase-like protein